MASFNNVITAAMAIQLIMSWNRILHHKKELPSSHHRYKNHNRDDCTLPDQKRPIIERFSPEEKLTLPWGAVLSLSTGRLTALFGFLPCGVVG